MSHTIYLVLEPQGEFSFLDNHKYVRYNVRTRGGVSRDDDNDNKFSQECIFYGGKHSAL